MDRGSLDRRTALADGPYRLVDRLTGAETALSRVDCDDLWRVHLLTWLEQVTRSRLGWDYRRAAYRGTAERLGGAALATYDRVFAAKPVG